MSFITVDTIHTSLGNYEKYKKKTRKNMHKKTLRKLPFNTNIPQAKRKPIISQIWKFQATAGHSAVWRDKVTTQLMT